MKKKPLEIKQIKGWTATSVIQTSCDLCDKFLSFIDPVYYRKVDGKEVVSCRGCADK